MVILWVLFYCIAGIYANEQLSCNLWECPDAKVIIIQKGNGHCNPECMTPYCNYDTSIYVDGLANKESSDCYWSCIYIDGCKKEMLGNGICDAICNTRNCGYDWGDCGYCAFSCKFYVGTEVKLQENCNPDCNVPPCYYGSGSCQECQPGCSSNLLGNGVCNLECAYPWCNFDFGDCNNWICAPGCFIWMFSNSICDEACHVPECNFDGWDCDCSPGCFKSMLGDGKCDPACNNWNCVLDNHDCGACASGCYPEMLGNGICNHECNNYDCEYDYKDCACSNGCTYLDYGKCKPECLVANCNFDRITQYPKNWCQNTGLAIFSSYQQIIRQDFQYVSYLENCFKASNYACDIYKVFETKNCFWECNILECNFANGNCNFYYILDPDCSKVYVGPYGLMCLSCKTKFLYYGFCIRIGNNPRTRFPDGSLVYVPYYDISSANNPHIYFATSIAGSDIYEGEGTRWSPYQHFLVALYFSKNAYTTIYLLDDGDYFLDINLDDLSGWGYFDSKKSLQNVLIASWSENQISIRQKNPDSASYQKLFEFWFSSLEMRNLLFDGKNFITCSRSLYCEYCPYIYSNSESYRVYNDRHEEIYEYLSSVYCEYQRYYYWFLMVNSNLILKNVTFKNFRFGHTALMKIVGSSNVVLNNVQFDNIKLAEIENSGVIIFVTYLSEYTFYDPTPGTFFYNYGKVSRLNNGYEFGDPINLRGFLYAPNITSIVIKNVEFEYNMIYINPLNILSSASLIALGWFESLVIDSCIFSYNYCELGIINIQNKYSYYSIEFNETEVLKYSTLTHIHITNTSFISNYGKSNAILSAHYYNETQNILIESSDFISNGAETSSIISIWSESMKDKFVNGKYINATTPSGLTVAVKYLPNFLTMKNLTFIDNYSGADGLIEIMHMANIDIEDILIKDNGDKFYEDSNLNSIILKYFINNPNIYLKLEASSPAHISCKSMALISGSVNLYMQNISAADNYCRSSSPAIIIDNTASIFIDLFKSERNIGAGSTGISLSFQNLYSATIKNSRFMNNLNYLNGSPGSIDFTNSSTLLIENCMFIENIADSGGALYFLGQNLHINYSHFESNQSPELSGGAIHWSVPQGLSISNSEFIISDTIFKNNSCSLNGGSIYLNKKYYSNTKMALSISNSAFFKNKAINGACIYIGNAIKLSSSSLVNNCTFKENYAALSGSLFISYFDGILSVDNSNFTENKGSYSSALHIAINENSEENPSKVLLNFCAFQWNKASATILLTDENKNATLETQFCLFEYNLGSIFSLDNDTLIDNNSTFQHGYSDLSGTVATLKNSAIISLKNAYFYNNTNAINGGVASLSYESEFYCMSCTLIKNYATNAGGIAYAESDSFFIIKDSKIEKNYCKNKGSVFAMIRCSKHTSKINNCDVNENSAKNGGTISLLSSVIEFDSSTFHHNLADDNNAGIGLSFSNITIRNTSFSDQSGNQGCFIEINANSNVLIEDSNFLNGFSTSSGTAIFSISSNVTILNSLFSNIASSSGGVIFIYKGSTLYVNDTVIQNSQGSVIDSYNSFIRIENSLFKKSTKSIIYGEELFSLQINSSEFHEGSGSSGGAIYCSKCESLIIDSCSFDQNIASESGGAVYFATEKDFPKDQYAISLSKFSNSKALNGGAIYVENLNFTVSTSKFIKNFADSSGLKNNENGVIDGIGGGINFSCKDFSHCFFNISYNNFTENSAVYNGGAISWKDAEPIIIHNNFERNSAEYGDDIASFPIMLAYQEIENAKKAVLQAPTIDGIASGQKNNKPIAFALVDHYNQIVKTDNISQAQMLSANSDTILFGVTRAIAASGIFNFTDYVITAKPGSLTKIKIYTSTIKEANGYSSSNPDFYADVKVRLCDFGEATVNITCLVCEKPYYSLNPNNTACLACPDHAKCYGNFTIVPDHGYWRYNKYTDHFWKCPYPPACLGSPDLNNISLTGNCKDGYKGNMCQSCDSGYSRLYKNECQKCPDTYINIMRMFGFIIIFIVIALLTIKAVKNSILGISAFTSVYIKIFWNYLHIIIIITTFDLNWPRWLMKFFYIELSMNYVGEQLFSLDCFFQKSNFKIEIFYAKLIFISFIPIMLWFLCLFAWILYYKIKKRAWKTISDNLISTSIILLFLIHPGLIETLFSIFSCREINSGEYWLNIDLDIQCWDFDHVFFSYLIALPAIIIWGVLVPAIWLVKLSRNKNKLEDTVVKLRYGFLYNGYTKTYFYWEFVILYCKITLISFSVFLSNISISIQALAVTILLIFFLFLQNKNKPFEDKRSNNMELFSKFTLLATVCTGLFFLTDELEYSGTVFVFIIAFCSNVSFIFYSLLKIFSEFLILLKEKFLLIRNIFFRKSGVKTNYIIEDSISEDIKNKHLNYTHITASRMINSSQEFESECFENNSNNRINFHEVDPNPSENSALASQNGNL